jgi:membrane protease YdiL (CAAX protease family)
MADSSTRSGALADNDEFPAVAAMLVVFFSHVVTRRAIVDTSVEHVLYEMVAVTLMLAVAIRSRLSLLAVPTAPISLRDWLPFDRMPRVVSALVFTALTISLTTVARSSGRLFRAFGYSPRSSCEGTADSACCTYNDPACSGDGMVVDIVEVFTASIGEELAYRYAVLVILSRIVGVRIAVAVQAVVFGLSHTGFEGGYGADLVTGLIAVGAVSAIAVLVTRSIWPAIAAHAVHSMGVAAFDHDLTAVSWAVTAVYLLSAFVSAIVISRIAVSIVFRQR